MIEERVSTHIYRQKQMLTKEELEARESLCVHEQPPYCNAACPLKLDVKAMTAAIAAGDFDRALGLYEKITPFPHLLAAACEAPCEAECKLCGLGEGVSVRALESAAVTWGTKAKGRSLLRKKPTKIGIFGADLMTVFLAGELAKKRYTVSLFCAQSGPEDLMARCIPDQAEALRQAAARTLAAMDLELCWNTDPAEEYRQRGEEFRIRAAAFSVARTLYPQIAPDPAVMVSRDHGLITGPAQGVLDAAFAAKKAALSADRMAQNLDPANTRGQEGSLETRLYTSLEGVAPSRRIPITDRESAIAEARRCIQCH